MNDYIDIDEYLNKCLEDTASYPRYRIDKIVDFIDDFISKHALYKDISIIPTGAKRNNTDISYMEYLSVYLIADTDEKDTRNFKKDIIKLLDKNNIEYNEVLESILFVYEKENIVLKPSFKIVEENNNIEGALITDVDGENTVYYPKLDNKNFDKKEHDCGANFINLIKIFKYLFQSFNGEIKSLNEFSYEIIEALIWNLPNEYFKFKNYRDAILDVLSYLYEKIASEEYIELSEINDIKVLFSTKNNINRKNALKGLYEVRKFIIENM